MRLLAADREQGGLYHLQTNHSPPASVSHHSSKAHTVFRSQLSAIWHMKLGHASHNVLNKIDYVSSYISHDCNKTCPICPIAK